MASPTAWIARGPVRGGLGADRKQDPFALRRTALGLTQLLTGKDLDFDLEWGLLLAGQALPVPFDAQVLKAALDFVADACADCFWNAATATTLWMPAEDPGCQSCQSRALCPFFRRVTAREDWTSILPAYSRCARITRDLKEIFPVSESALVESEERGLLASVLAAQTKLENSADLDAALEAVRQMVPEINAFFDRLW